MWAAGNVAIGDLSQPGVATVEGDATSSGGDIKIAEDAIVLGNAWAQGNVTNKKGTTVGSATSGGDVTAITGEVEVKNDGVVWGDIWAQGKVEVRDRVTVGSAASGGDVTSITGRVHVHKDSVVWGDVWAGGSEAKIHNNAQVNGSIYSAGDVTLQDGVIVTGKVVAVGQIFLEGSAQILSQGTVPSGTPPTNPSIPLDSSAERLGQALVTWDISPPLTLQPGAQVSLSFVAKAISTDGNYCNEARVEPGGVATTTGLTAQVQVGAQAGACQTPVYLVSETVDPSILAAGDDPAAGFTYSMTIDNATGTENLTLSKIQNLLPAGFEYVAFEVTIPPPWEASTTVTTSTFEQREMVT